MNLLLYGTDAQRIEYFRRRMDESSVGSEDYRKAQQILAFLCNRLRAKDRVEEEANASKWDRNLNLYVYRCDVAGSSIAMIPYPNVRPDNDDLAQRIMNSIIWGSPKGFGKYWADEFTKFRKEMKQGEFLEKSDHDYQQIKDQKVEN